MIYWEDTINIIKIFFEIKYKDIASYLGVKETVISKVKKGWQNPPVQFTPSYIYHKIFDPSKSGTPASLRKKKTDDVEEEERVKADLLDDLRSIITDKFSNVYKALGNYWNVEDYEEFVIALLERTRQKPLVESKPKCTKVRAKSVSISEVSGDSPSADGTLKADTTKEEDVASSSQVSGSRGRILGPEDVHMPDDFFDGLICYKIPDFFKLNLMDWIETNSMFGQSKPEVIALIQNATDFVKHMDVATRFTEITEQNERILKEITNYINDLRKYIEFLQESVADPLQFVAGVYADQKAIDEAIAEFELKAAEYRANLQSQYKKVDDCIDHSLDPFKVFSGFNVPKYRLKKP